MAISLTLNQILSSVAGETTVPPELLVENDEFMDIIRAGGFTIATLIDWVNENY